MQVHRVVVRVFSKPEDDLSAVQQGLFSLVPFDLDNEKIKLSSRSVTGFNERKIKILEIKLKKQKHVRKFLENLHAKLSEEQRTLISNEAESRLDDELDFYLRLDKQKLISDKKIWITDKGDCYHIKLAIATFPKSKEKALECIKNLF